MGELIRATVPLKKWNEEKQIRDRLVFLFRQFFFCEDVSTLEAKIEYMYLEVKLEKYLSYQSLKVA